VTARLVELCRASELPIPGALALLGVIGSRGDSNRLNRYLDPMAIQNNIVKACVLEERQGASEEGAPEELEYAALSNLESYPPTLLVTGTRDQLLSSTAHFYRRLVASGADAELNVYEGMPHAHHAISHLPESAEALRELADFFDRKLQ
jgi:acetyl esterase/lipase